MPASAAAAAAALAAAAASACAFISSLTPAGAAIVAMVKSRLIVGTHALGQRHGRDVERVVDVEAGQVDQDLLRDRVGQALDRNPVADDVEHAAAADARRGALVDELDGHVDRQARAFDDAQEIDVQRPVADRVELIVARDGADLLAGDVDRRDGREEAAAVDLEIHVAVGEIDRYRGLLAAIDDGRDQTLTTDGTGGPLAHLFANRRRELVTSAHRTTPFQAVSRVPPGVSARRARL